MHTTTEQLRQECNGWEVGHGRHRKKQIIMMPMSLNLDINFTCIQLLTLILLRNFQIVTNFLRSSLQFLCCCQNAWVVFFFCKITLDQTRTPGPGICVVSFTWFKFVIKFLSSSKGNYYSILFMSRSVYMLSFILAKNRK